MPSIRIYNDIKWIPHTFIGITDDNGNTIYRGFSPEKTGLLGTGSVKDENVDNKLHEFTTLSYEIQISNEQYQKAIDFIEYSQNNPPVYNLPAGAQCTIWALEVLEKGGIISVPHYMPKGIEAAIPGQFVVGLFESIAYNPYTFAFGDAVNIGFDIVADEINNNLEKFAEYLNELAREAIEEVFNSDEIWDKNNDVDEQKDAKENQDDEKINFDGLKDDENIENKDEEQEEQIPEEIEENNEELSQDNNTNGNATNNATNIVELAQQNVSLYNQNINKGYDDIMSFLSGW